MYWLGVLSRITLRLSKFELSTASRVVEGEREGARERRAEKGEREREREHKRRRGLKEIGKNRHVCYGGGLTGRRRRR